ncbi:MAG: GerW family sporulation protein [Clostridia bacterium]|nr:GerW family sporulation protein [Clostridia bacterium]
MSGVNESMGITIEKIKNMIDVNTVVGDPITTPDGTTLIPVSKVSFGFASGGTDGTNMRFGAGAGAGVNITPIAFIVIKDGNTRMIYVQPPVNSAVDKIIDMIPEAADKVTEFIKNRKNKETSEDEAVY